MDYVLVKRDSDEWYFMWNLLAVHPSNQGLPFPLTAFYLDEEWQYMCTDLRQPDNPFHGFRHRCHPRFGTTLRIEIPVSYSFNQKLNEKGIYNEQEMRQEDGSLFQGLWVPQSDKEMGIHLGGETVWICEVRNLMPSA